MSYLKSNVDHGNGNAKHIGEQGRPITDAEARHFSLKLTQRRLDEERLEQDQQRDDLNNKLTGLA